MNEDHSFEVLEVFPMPPGVIEVEDFEQFASARSLAVAALQQALRDRLLTLPLGPHTAFDDEQRLLVLNRFSVQLSTAGFLVDELGVDATPWKSVDTAPQLLLPALVDMENGIVLFPGVLTGGELLELIGGVELHDGVILLDPLTFQGGVDRLFSLVQLLEPEALPSLAMTTTTTLSTDIGVAVLDWLSGQLDQAFSVLGGELRPVSAGVFRGDPVASSSADDVLAVLVIPFGLSSDEHLVSGNAARRCVRQFLLTLVPTGSGLPTGLFIRLSSAVSGALLPDGLELVVCQGSHKQTMTSAMSTELEVVFQASDQLLDVSLRYGVKPPVVLPSLRLPA